MKIRLFGLIVGLTICSSLISCSSNSSSSNQRRVTYQPSTGSSNTQPPRIPTSSAPSVRPSLPTNNSAGGQYPPSLSSRNNNNLGAPNFGSNAQLPYYSADPKSPNYGARSVVPDFGRVPPLSNPTTGLGLPNANSYALSPYGNAPGGNNLATYGPQLPNNGNTYGPQMPGTNPAFPYTGNNFGAGNANPRLGYNAYGANNATPGLSQVKPQAGDPNAIAQPGTSPENNDPRFIDNRFAPRASQGNTALRSPATSDRVPASNNRPSFYAQPGWARNYPNRGGGGANVGGNSVTSNNGGVYGYPGGTNERGFYGSPSTGLTATSGDSGLGNNVGSTLPANGGNSGFSNNITNRGLTNNQSLALPNNGVNPGLTNNFGSTLPANGVNRGFTNNQSLALPSNGVNPTLTNNFGSGLPANGVNRGFTNNQSSSLPDNRINPAFTNNAGNSSGFGTNNSNNNRFDNDATNSLSVNQPTNRVPVNSAGFQRPNRDDGF